MLAMEPTHLSTQVSFNAFLPPPSEGLNASRWDGLLDHMIIVIGLSQWSHDREFVLLVPDHKHRSGVALDNLDTLLGVRSKHALSTETSATLNAFL